MERLEGRRLAATIAVLVWLVADGVQAAVSVLTLAAIGGTGPIWPHDDLVMVDRVTSVSAIIYLIAYACSVTLVARWIMRANANAHTLSDSMTISPGWNVGWFFVPIATLFKPFEGLRQTWQVSVDPDDPGAVPVPAVMHWWWGLWIVGNLFGSASFQVSMRVPGLDGLRISNTFDIISFVIDLPMTYLFLTFLRQLTARQDGFGAGRVIAVPAI